MTDEEIIVSEINEFNASDKRQWMLIGDKYYRVDNDILNRRITLETEEGTIEDPTKANNKLAHGFMKNSVDEKTAYIFTKDYALDCDNEKYVEKVKEVLGKYFQYTLSKLGKEASNKGIAWLHTYIDEEGKFKTMLIPSEQCVPIWKDNTHTELYAMIRFYVVTVYEGKEKKKVTKVEYHTPIDVSYFILQDDTLIPDIEQNEGGPNPHYYYGEEFRSWGRVPFIGFKNNSLELPDVKFVKTLIDDYDKSRSDVSNYIDETGNYIIVLKGYGGQNKGELVKSIKYYRTISIDDPEYGGVDTLTPDMDISAIKEHYEQTERNIVKFGGNIPKDLDKFGNNPSGVAMKYLFAGIDLKCNDLEVEFKQAFDNLVYFINVYLSETGQGNYANEKLDIIFNRDITINETEAINNINNSQDILSLETLIAQHPYVSDVEEELKKVLAERLERQKEQAKMFGSDRFSQIEGEGNEK